MQSPPLLLTRTRFTRVFSAINCKLLHEGTAVYSPRFLILLNDEDAIALIGEGQLHGALVVLVARVEEAKVNFNLARVEHEAFVVLNVIDESQLQVLHLEAHDDVRDLLPLLDIATDLSPFFNHFICILLKFFQKLFLLFLSLLFLLAFSSTED